MQERLTQQLKKNIIPFWLSLKDERGGFYGRAKQGERPMKDAPKGAIMHCKLLWFFSRAYQCFKAVDLLEAATCAFKFIYTSFYDRSCGGLYWSVTADGRPCDETKHAYSLAMGIYGLTAYWDVSRDDAALELAFELFNTLEFKCRRQCGYHEQFDRNFYPETGNKYEEPITSPRNVKTLLHIMEAYIDLYYKSKNETVKAALKNVYSMIKIKLFDKHSGKLTPYFDDRLNSVQDAENYGLDFTASWLMTSAAQVLQIVTDEDMQMIKRLVEAPLKDGIDSGAVINNRIGKKFDADRYSWAQSEAIVALLNAYTLFSDEKYLTVAKGVWHFISEQFMDPIWYRGTTAKGQTIAGYQADLTVGPYRNVRMILEVLRRKVDLEL